MTNEAPGIPREEGDEARPLQEVPLSERVAYHVRFLQSHDWRHRWSKICEQDGAELAYHPELLMVLIRKSGGQILREPTFPKDALNVLSVDQVLELFALGIRFEVSEKVASDPKFVAWCEEQQMRERGLVEEAQRQIAAAFAAGHGGHHSCSHTGS